MIKSIKSVLMRKSGLWAAFAVGWLIGSYRLGAGDVEGAVRSVAVSLIWVIPLIRAYFGSPKNGQKK